MSVFDPEDVVISNRLPDPLIRLATPADLPELLRMGRAFHAEAGLACFPPFHDGAFTSFVTRLSRNGDGVVLVGEHDTRLAGMAAALAYPTWWNTDHAMGQEVFWYVDPDLRGSRLGAALLDGLERWAADMGLSMFSMVAIEKLDPRVARHYRARGYEAQETIYSKGVW